MGLLLITYVINLGGGLKSNVSHTERDKMLVINYNLFKNIHLIHNDSTPYLF